jgi:hypothetical protein
VEHIRARKHGGTDAWSCQLCNLFKSSNLSGVDSQSNRVVPLFDPRRQKWVRHFRWEGPVLAERTASGRATIAVLDLNLPHRARMRELLAIARRFST